MVAFSRLVCTLGVVSTVSGLSLLKKNPEAKKDSVAAKVAAEVAPKLVEASKKLSAETLKLRSQAKEASLYGPSGCDSDENICETCEEICNIGECNVPGVWSSLWDDTQDTAAGAAGAVGDVASAVTPQGIHDAVSFAQHPFGGDVGSRCLTQCREKVDECVELFDDPGDHTTLAHVDDADLDDTSSSQFPDLDAGEDHVQEQRKECIDVKKFVMISETGNVRLALMYGFAPEFTQLAGLGGGSPTLDGADLDMLAKCADGGAHPYLNIGAARQMTDCVGRGNGVDEREFYADLRCSEKCLPAASNCENGEWPDITCGSDFGEVLTAKAITGSHSFFDSDVKDPEEYTESDQVDSDEVAKAIHQDALDESHTDYDGHGKYEGDYTHTTDNEEVLTDEKKDEFYEDIEGDESFLQLSQEDADSEELAADIEGEDEGEDSEEDADSDEEPGNNLMASPGKDDHSDSSIDSDGHSHDGEDIEDDGHLGSDTDGFPEADDSDFHRDNCPGEVEKDGYDYSFKMDSKKAVTEKASVDKARHIKMQQLEKALTRMGIDDSSSFVKKEIDLIMKA